MRGRSSPDDPGLRDYWWPRRKINFRCLSASDVRLAERQDWRCPVCSQAVSWTKRLYHRQEEAEVLDNVLTPPAVVNGKLFVGTILGEVCCLSTESGEVLWRDALDEPVIFQPAVVGGHVYAATGAGSLFRIGTGDPRDDGWPMWGGSAAHNGLPSEVPQTAGLGG